MELKRKTAKKERHERLSHWSWDRNFQTDFHLIIPNDILTIYIIHVFQRYVLNFLT